LCGLYETENRALVASNKRLPAKVLAFPATPLVVRRYEVELDCEWRFVNLDAEVAQKRDYPLLGVSIWDAWPDLIGSKVHLEYQIVMETRKPRLFENIYEPRGVRHQHWVYPVKGGIVAQLEEFELFVGGGEEGDLLLG